ncbi:M28 family peptidase [Stieleria varia]|uniref:Peptidase family M28 n=1 Tax=Stieleria varia TaxID=2528005 RepID=A0A5C5ZX73_9BACT|nr:M28 family peptidase [Stieleria varia]TWT91567.1 Peptidase family M28 [Stieleria varia]
MSSPHSLSTRATGSATHSRQSPDSQRPEPRHHDTIDAAANRKSSFGFWGMILLTILSVGGLLIAWNVITNANRDPDQIEPPAAVVIPAQYDADRAMAYLKQLCELGPRPSGSEAMIRQQQMLTEFFEARGATVSLQSFQTRHPEDGSPLTMSNLIATWHPERPKRYLLCAHYDTRPFPDSDPVNPRGTFIGANDGASGTAGLMELSHQLGDLPSDVGVDIVLFDGEEFVWKYGRDKYFLGSTYFAEQYRQSPPPVPYQSGILLDMIGDRELKIYYELNSLRFAKRQCESLWNTAKRLRVTAFVPRSRHKIDDDHIPLNNIAGIPTLDIIDFDYPRPGIGVQSYWHTEQDIPANCSGQSIAAVVWVVHQWLKEQ